MIATNQQQSSRHRTGPFSGLAKGSRPVVRVRRPAGLLTFLLCLAGGVGAVLAVPARAADKSDKPESAEPAATEPATRTTTANPAPASPAAAANPQDLARAESQILAVFKDRCANCHQEGMSKKVKKFGYVMDLDRMARGPDKKKYVHPGESPDKSKLWSSIEDDSMPPDDDPKGPLDPKQKTAVLAALGTWIAAGAPAPAPGTVTATAGPSAQGGAVATSAAPAKPKTLFVRLRRLLGHYHLLLAHFPIALLVGAAVAELAWLRTRESWLVGAVRFCTVFGALGAFVTAILGWIYYMEKAGTADAPLNWHRWLGTVAAVWAIPVLLLSEQGFRRRRDDPGAVGRPYLWFQVMLFVGVVLVGVAAHYGGLSVNGEEFLSF